MKISIPKNKKEIQSFLGKINFLRWFIPNFAKIVKQITRMLKRDREVKWSAKARLPSKNIKRALMEAPVLVTPYFTKDSYFFLLHPKVL